MVIATIIIATFPCLSLLTSDVEYIYPTEVSFELANMTNSSFTFYFNFGLQALGLFNWTLQINMILLIFFVLVINVLSDLKVIACLCLMVGEAEDKSSRDVMIEDLENETEIIQCSERSKTNSNLTTSKLLKIILKYHSRIIM